MNNIRLNTLAPVAGSKKAKKRLGRGIGSGLGKTAGRGHKGLKSRSGGTVKPGFEGGQMPLQKCLPKYGFSSRIDRVSSQIRLSELNKVDGEIVSLATLLSANLINQNIKRVKIFLSGELDKTVVVKGLPVTKGARAAIEAAGGSIEVDQ